MSGGADGRGAHGRDEQCCTNKRYHDTMLTCSLLSSDSQMRSSSGGWGHHDFAKTVGYLFLVEPAPSFSICCQSMDSILPPHADRLTVEITHGKGSIVLRGDSPVPDRRTNKGYCSSIGFLQAFVLSFLSLRCLFVINWATGRVDGKGRMLYVAVN